jgi:hypothetical protein
MASVMEVSRVPAWISGSSLSVISADSELGWMTQTAMAWGCWSS